MPFGKPLYVPQGRPITGTKNPLRPQWIDAIKRPIRIVGSSTAQFDTFLRWWKFDRCECLQIFLVGDLAKLPVTTPLLVLPGGEDASNIPDFCPVKHWRERGGCIVRIPDCAVRGQILEDGRRVFAHFPIETNMEAETVIAIALHRHLDGLNAK